MKRTVTIVLFFLVLIMSCACGNSDVASSSKPMQVGNSNASGTSVSDIDTTESTAISSSELVSDNNSDIDNSSEKTVSTESDGTPSVADTSVIPSTPSVPSTSESQLPEVTDAKHTALKTTEYYQYSNMTANEKKLYDRLRVSALSYQNSTDVSDLSFTLDAAMSVMERFKADNPQYFWVGHKTTVSYNSSTGIVSKCIMFYSDGTVTDDLSTKTANRNTIEAKRSELEAVVKTIVGKINPAADDYTKEKYIHDYLAGTMKYDTVTAGQDEIIGDDADKNAFNAYGALIEKKGVCEAYSKAFQYLCYEVGINSNQVIGVDHMWNVAKIGGDWYQVDVTWDDPIVNGGTIDIITYDYFNKTTSEMNDGKHILSSNSTLKVPNCTATKYQYKG